MPTREVLVLLASLACCASENAEHEEQVAKLTPAELAHKRHFWSIGEGFEGSASDWTEYVVWLLGVAGVFYYMANPNARRNLHAIEDDGTAHRFENGEHHDALFDEDDAAAADSGDQSGDERGERSPVSEQKKER